MVDLQPAPSDVALHRLVFAVKRLWWGAMFVFIDFTVGGWDLSSDVIGLALVTWACYVLFNLRRADKLGQTGLAMAAATMVLAVLYSIPATAESYPWAEFVGASIAQVGIVVVAIYVARLLRIEGLMSNASQWEKAARWQTATGISLLVFGGVVFFAGGFRTLSPDADAVFDWAIASPVGLVALVVLTAVGLIASVMWVRAAWALWKY